MVSKWTKSYKSMICGFFYCPKTRLPRLQKEKEEKEWGYVDYITLSSSLLFSMKYKTSLEGLRKESLYNNIRKSGYQLTGDYLDGLTVTHEDYKTVFNQYKEIPNTVFFVDPPYLSTDVGT